MKIKNLISKIFIFIFLAVIVITLSSCGKNEPINDLTTIGPTTTKKVDVKPTKFKFAAYRSGIIGEADIYYDDSFFNEPSTTLSSDLTSASICLALSGFSPVRNNDYTASGKYAEELLTNLGFINFKSNSDGVSRPTDSSFGVYLAMKEINDSTLIAITTRGSNYGMEWVSNLKMGNSGDFLTGFYEASSVYIDSLKSYILENNITGKIKIWTAGYSRGAASVNVAIGRIDEALLDNNPILGENVSYSIDDIYAYTYEAPRGRIATIVNNEIKEKGSNFSNIHNFININDFITYFGPSEYGFVRYGLDHYLPDTLNRTDFSTHLNNIKEIIKKYDLEKCAGKYTISDFRIDDSISSSYTKYNWTLGKFAESFINELSIGIGSRENFSNNTQEFFSELFSLIFKGDAPSDSLYLVFNSLKNKIDVDEVLEIAKRNLYGLNNKMWKELKPLIDDMIKDSAIEEMGSDKIIELFKFIYDSVLNTTSLKEGPSALLSLKNSTNLDALICAHYAEINLACILAMDERYLSNNNVSKTTTNYYKLVVDTELPFKIVSLNNNKTLLSFISTDNALLTTLVVEKHNNEYTIYLPSDSNYKILCDNELIGSLYNISGELAKETKLDNSSSIISGNITLK